MAARARPRARLAALVLPLLVSGSAAYFVPGCQGTCDSDFDCGARAFCQRRGGGPGRCTVECFTDQDCLVAPECRANPSACRPRGEACSPRGRCEGAEDPPPEAMNDRPVDVGALEFIEGWDAPPGSGRIFVVSELAVAPEGEGFDVNGACREPGDCEDNALWRLGTLGNDQIRQGLLGGETLLLIELAGLDEPYTGHDPNLTVKFYGARDADDPFRADNNFRVPPGEDQCCQFKIVRDSLDREGTQSRARVPARIRRGVLETLAPVPLAFRLTVGLPPHPDVRIRQSRVSARLPSSLARLSDGLLGGAIPMEVFSSIDNPYCKTLNSLCEQVLPESSLLDLVSTFIRPDIDLDIPPDGLERLEQRGGRVARCYDGDGSVVSPPSPQDPAWMCALSPQMADGFSIGLRFAALPAHVAGFAD